MITPDDAREAVRPPLVLLVDHHVEQGSDRMQAYGRVAGLVGRSSAWVRRVLGRDPRATVGLHDALNIRAAYDRVCAHVEATTARVDALADALEDYADEAPARTSRSAARSVPAPARAAARRRQDLRLRRATLIPVSALAAA